MSIVQSALDRVKKDRDSSGRMGSGWASIGNREAPQTPEPAAAAAPLVPAKVAWPQSRSAPVEVSPKRLCEVGLFPGGDDLRQQQDDYRNIRREVISAMLARPSNEGRPVGAIVVITSAVPGDGKSYNATNLALSIASEGIRDVLLVDGDTIRRTVTTAFGLEDRPGLLELLSAPPASFMDHVLPTTHERLRLLPAGQRTAESTDLFSAGRVAPLFNAMNAALAGHVVIVDSPPILMSSETQALVDSAGQVLLVVRSGVTLQDLVREAAGRIKDSVPVGLILNGWEPAYPSDYQLYLEYGK
jgi:receptor protein-tyrosine kinase